jgi:predicted TPR repeat methyltransferase
MLACLTGAGPGAEAGYVAGLYDGYAGDFDQHLTGQLGYDVPAEMRRMLAGLLASPVASLDLGCGTGLVAEALQGLAAPVDGIDLSPAMVERARRRSRYRRLAIGNLVELTGRGDFAGPYGLVTAADVFIHVPDLRAAFTAVSRALAPGGLFVFATEDGDEPRSVRSSGRFAHGRRHIRTLAGESEMKIEAEMNVTVRLERLRPVPGGLFALRRPAR